MSRMFVTAAEAASILRVSEQDLSRMIASGQLAEFRDRNRIMLKREQVELLAPHESELESPLSFESGLGIFDLNEGSRDASTRREDASSDSDGEGISIFSLDDDDSLARDNPLVNIDGILGNEINKTRDPSAAGRESREEFEDLTLSLREAPQPDPEESQQTLPTTEGLFLLAEIDRALAICTALDRPKAKALIGAIDRGYALKGEEMQGEGKLANIFIGNLTVKDWEQLREDLRDPESRAGLSVAIAKKRLGHVRDLVLQALSRTDRPTVRDADGVSRDMSILRGIHFAKAYEEAANTDRLKQVEIDLQTEVAYRRAQRVAQTMVERISKKRASM